MLNMLFKLVFLCLSLVVSVPASAANLTKAQSDALLQQVSVQQVQSFAEFLAFVSTTNPELADVVRVWQAEPQANPQTLTAEQQAQIFRLLGIYTRVRYADEAREILKELYMFLGFQPK